MTTVVSRKRRGSETQSAVARWFAASGWPYAESAGAGRTGSDITGIPGLACEVKARRELRLISWLRQAATGPGLPFVVHRPDGMGTAAIASWPVTLRLEDFTRLLHEAGYGSHHPGQPMTRPYCAPISPARLLAAYAVTRWRAWLARRRADAGWSPLDEPEET